MHAKPDPALVDLYLRAQICRAFPGSYFLEGSPKPAEDASVKALWAMQLLNAAEAIRS